MRKILTTKAGATFNLECPDFTHVVRKDVIEIVFKVKPGIFIVINFARIDATDGSLLLRSALLHTWQNLKRRTSYCKVQDS